MTTPPHAGLGLDNHPIGRIAMGIRRNAGEAKINALAGYRMDLLPSRSVVSRIDAVNSTTFGLTG
ncbi:hypothetical protein DMH04_30145 [Kibdelosporangium aridum]|uniref:Uncharacterized protein n=1 Tax=Kibdelosporangium aridum TaxID=2030 RepID=A0A428Z397_KIBAR|nr:hypothetical protein [Kibdelosporangium aridum]RSM80395.1 hypothetical protein DMH04_30145 [Kibdelosporangium aridum]